MTKIALVTGANKGIGFEISRQLGKKGFTVLIGARDAQKGKAAADSLKKENIDAIFLPLDVSKKESILDAKQWVEKTYGKLDVLINNAGIISHKNLYEADSQEMTDVLQTNFHGPLLMNSIFLPVLKKASNARIINLSSGMGAMDDLSGTYGSYRLSKAGLNMQTILLASELASIGIKVMAMCPGWVQTDMGGKSAPRSVEKGAETAVWLAEAAEVETGKFYRDKRIISW